MRDLLHVSNFLFGPLQHVAILVTFAINLQKERKEIKNKK
uniref:Uncharacterized protein n=1 Tax=Rhizophora mucronata TaxID=61149 RepID=A0A2P2NWK3_RHIMU